MKFTVLCLLALAALVCAQDNEVKFIIDPFTAVSDTIVIVIPTGGVTGPSLDPVSNFVQSGTIMGGERDLQLTVTSGDGNLVLSTGVSGGVFSAATPNEARGNSLLQLDGVDGAMTLQTNGLFGHPNNNFLAEEAFAFRVVIESDLPGSVIFRVFSGGPVSNSCSLTVSTPGDDTANEYILPYSSFTGTCDFSNVGALEIFIIMNDNIDVLLSDWSTYGPIVECTCFCPAFTCQLLLDPDDDYFSYYLTSQFGNYGNPNPTTDLSTLYSDGTRFYNPTTDLSTIYTGGTVFFNIDDDDYFFFDIDFSTDTSDTSRTSRDTSNTSRFSSNDSSSDASVMTASILLLIVAALF